MQAFIVLIVLFSCFFSTTPYASEIESKPVVVDVHLNKKYDDSRNAAVKIVTGFGHGTGTYVKVGKTYGILTAAHVVDAAELYIIEAGAYRTIATLLWKDEESDVAFLVIDKFDRLDPLKIATARNVDVGDELIYSGFPSMHQMLSFSCSVSNEDYNGMLVVHGYAWFGASGSGFVDSRGKVVGVLSAVSVEDFYGHPQVIETLVIAAPILPRHIAAIKASIGTIN